MIDQAEQLANLHELEIALREAIGRTNDPVALSRFYWILKEVRDRIQEVALMSA